MRVDDLQPEETTAFGSDWVCVSVHGWAPFWPASGFQKRCGLHRLIRTLYPISPYWRFKNWAERDWERVVGALIDAEPDIARKNVVMAGISDAAAILWNLCEVFKPKRIVHWSGFWGGKLYNADSAVFVSGAEDPFGAIVRSTERAAIAHSAQFYRPACGHEWFSGEQDSFNKLLLKELA